MGTVALSFLVSQGCLDSLGVRREPAVTTIGSLCDISGHPMTSAALHRASRAVAGAF